MDWIFWGGLCVLILFLSAMLLLGIALTKGNNQPPEQPGGQQ